jgi:hypothetical protein
MIPANDAIRQPTSTTAFTSARLAAQFHFKQFVHGWECGHVIEMVVASYRLATACEDIRSAMLCLIDEGSPLVGASRYEISALREVVLGAMMACLESGMSPNATVSSRDAVRTNAQAIDRLLTKAIARSLQ